MHYSDVNQCNKGSMSTMLTIYAKCRWRATYYRLYSNSFGPKTCGGRVGYTPSYTYEADENRATKSLNSVTEVYSYSNCDELTQIAVGGNTTKSFGYDDCGRMELQVLRREFRRVGLERQSSTIRTIWGRSAGSPILLKRQLTLEAMMPLGSFSPVVEVLRRLLGTQERGGIRRMLIVD